MRKTVGALLVMLGASANHAVCLQESSAGQACASLHGWRACAGLLVSPAVILIGMMLLARPRTVR